MRRRKLQATLRAKLDGYEAEGAVNKNPKAQEG